MNKTIYAEFIFSKDECFAGTAMLREMHTDFRSIGSRIVDVTDDYGNIAEAQIVSGELNAETATIMKLQNTFLSARMRVSHIPDTLKDKYRK